MSFWKELEESERKEFRENAKKLRCDLSNFDLYFKSNRSKKRLAKHLERVDLIKAYNDLLNETPLDVSITESDNIGYTFNSDIDVIRRKIHKIEQILLNHCSFCQTERENKDE